MPNIEFKRKARLTRQEAAERLIALGNALASGSEFKLSSGGDTLKLGVADHVDWELEIEIDGSETELEIEIKWTDAPSSDAEPDVPSAGSDPATPPAAEAIDPEPAKPVTPRRGRPRKVTTS